MPKTIIRIGECSPYGKGRNSCFWFTNIKDALNYIEEYKLQQAKFFIKIGRKPYRETSIGEVN